MQNQEEKRQIELKGFVRAVHSGDCVTISRSTKHEHIEEQVFLAYIQSPRIGN